MCSLHLPRNNTCRLRGVKLSIELVLSLFCRYPWIQFDYIFGNVNNDGHEFHPNARIVV